MNLRAKFQKIRCAAHSKLKSNSYDERIYSKIGECKPNGTGEVERLMSTLNRVMTVDRTTMTPSHLQSLCMISHESRRMFENNPVKIIEMLPKIQPHLAAKRKEFSAAVGEFQKKKKKI